MTGILFWLQQTLIAADQLVNAAIGGWADETLSSRAWRMEQEGKPRGRFWRPVIDTLFFWQTNHCRNAYLEERKRLQAPPETR